MRRHVLRWVHRARCAWDRHCATLATAPDPHGQFPALPLDWYVGDRERPGDHPAPHIPAQRTGPPHRHSDHRR